MDFVEYFSSLLSSFHISAIHFFFFFFFFLLALHKLHFPLVKNLSGLDFPFIDFPFNIFSFTRLFDFWLLLYYYFILWGLPISSFSPVSGLSQCFYLLTHFCWSIQLLVHSKCSWGCAAVRAWAPLTSLLPVTTNTQQHHNQCMGS